MKRALPAQGRIEVTSSSEPHLFSLLTIDFTSITQFSSSPLPFNSSSRYCQPPLLNKQHSVPPRCFPRLSLAPFSSPRPSSLLLPLQTNLTATTCTTSAARPSAVPLEVLPSLALWLAWIETLPLRPKTTRPARGFRRCRQRLR